MCKKNNFFFFFPNLPNASLSFKTTSDGLVFLLNVFQLWVISLEQSMDSYCINSASNSNFFPLKTTSFSFLPFSTNPIYFYLFLFFYFKFFYFFIFIFIYFIFYFFYQSNCPKVKLFQFLPNPK